MAPLAGELSPQVTEGFSENSAKTLWTLASLATVPRFAGDSISYCRFAPPASTVISTEANVVSEVEKSQRLCKEGAAFCHADDT